MSAFDPDQAEEYYEFTKRIKLMQAEINRATFKANANIENSLKQQRRLQMVMTRSVGGGGVLGSAFNMLQTVGGVKQQQFQDKKRRMGELKEKGIGMNQVEVQELRGLQGKKSGMERLDDTFEKYFGGDSKWNKMFGGHGKMAAAGLGMGAVGGGMALTKAIIDSSMMLQQMLKLLQFGVMLVLKPIGDFFGFLMRPILILLLRKFIIPFYQKVYPWFVTQGAKIGDGIASLVDYFGTPQFAMVAGGVIATSIAAVLKGGKMFTEKVMDDFAKKIGVQVASAQKGGADVVDDVIKSAAEKTTKKTPAWINEDGSYNKNWQKQQAALKNAQPKTSGIVDETDKMTKEFQKGNTSFDFDQKKKGNVFNQLRDQFSKVEARVNNRKWNPASVKNLVNLGKSLFKGLPAGMAADGLGVTDAVINEAFKLVEGVSKLAGVHIDLPTMGSGGYDPTQVGGIAAANGFNGMVNKPTMFLAGERGSEHVQVTPHGRSSGGTTVNITIGNMSGNANDLNKLRSTILEVMQTVNVNRGR